MESLTQEQIIIIDSLKAFFDNKTPIEKPIYYSKGVNIIDYDKFIDVNFCIMINSESKLCRNLAYYRLTTLKQNIENGLSLFVDKTSISNEDKNNEFYF